LKNTVVSGYKKQEYSSGKIYQYKWAARGRSLAQLVARLPTNWKVGGSNLGTY
jgi:hypothetical protein